MDTMMDETANLPGKDQVVAALKILSPYFRETWAPAFKKGGIFITLNPGFAVDSSLRDIDRKILDACATTGMVEMLSPQNFTSDAPAFNPAYPEHAFMSVVNRVLGLSGGSDGAHTVLLMPSAPRYLVINGDDNLRILAQNGIKFPGCEKFRPGAPAAGSVPSPG